MALKPVRRKCKSSNYPSKPSGVQDGWLQSAKDDLSRWIGAGFPIRLSDGSGESVLVAPSDIITVLPPLYQGIIYDMLTVPESWNDTQFSHAAAAKYGVKWHDIRRKRHLTLLALAGLENGLKIHMSSRERLTGEARDLIRYITSRLMWQSGYWVVDRQGRGSYSTVPGHAEAWNPQSTAAEAAKTPTEEGEDTMPTETTERTEGAARYVAPPRGSSRYHFERTIAQAVLAQGEVFSQEPWADPAKHYVTGLYALAQSNRLVGNIGQFIKEYERVGVLTRLESGATPGFRTRHLPQAGGRLVVYEVRLTPNMEDILQKARTRKTPEAPEVLEALDTPVLTRLSGEDAPNGDDTLIEREQTEQATAQATRMAGQAGGFVPWTEENLNVVLNNYLAQRDKAIAAVDEELARTSKVLGNAALLRELETLGGGNIVADLAPIEARHNDLTERRAALAENVVAAYTVVLEHLDAINRVRRIVAEFGG